MRSICIVNQSTLVSAADLAAAVSALQIQVMRDFAGAWGIDAQLTGVMDMPPESGEVIYLLDDTNQADALGYHTLSAKEAPVGYVFVKTTIDAGDHWQATLSHELLEQLLDPDASAAWIVPFNGAAVAAVAYEACDAVENDEYLVNEIPVSNFLLPGWGAPGFTGPVDFLGKLKAPLTLDAGGYVAYSTTMRTWKQVFAERCPEHQQAVARYSRRHRRMKKRVA